MLFPSFTPAQEVLTELRRRVNESGIEVMTSTEVAGFTKESVTLADGRTLPLAALIREIDDTRAVDDNLSSALRLYVLEWLKERMADSPVS